MDGPSSPTHQSTLLDALEIRSAWRGKIVSLSLKPGSRFLHLLSRRVVGVVIDVDVEGRSLSILLEDCSENLLEIPLDAIESFIAH